MSPILSALLWAPLSFCLHVGMHEGSHALMGEALGHRVSHFGITDRGVAATYFVPDGRWSPAHAALISSAPLMLDAVYAPAMVLLASKQPADSWARGVLLTEAAMSAAFMMIWASGHSIGTDGNEFTRATGVSAQVMFVVPVGTILGLIVPTAISTQWL